MEEKLDGIVVGSVNFGESDKILTIFTPDKGVISAKIKGVKKAGAKLKFASEPFCFAEYVFATSGDRRTVISASLIDSFYPIREDVYKFFAAGVVGEFVRKFFKEEMVEEQTFLLVADALKKLAYGDECAKSVLCGFLIEALFNSGYGLNLDGCAICGEEIKTRPYFDWSGGGFYCESCREERGREVNLSTYNALKKARRGEKLSDEEATLALRLLDFYMINKTEENIKALKELTR